MSKPKKIRKLVKSAKMGKPYAMYQLGICYQLGKEMPSASGRSRICTGRRMDKRLQL